MRASEAGHVDDALVIEPTDPCRSQIYLAKARLIAYSALADQKPHVIKTQTRQEPELSGDN